jgi:hypothetical protein
VSGFEAFLEFSPTRRLFAQLPRGLEWVPYGSLRLSDKRPRHCFTEDRRFESLWNSKEARDRVASTIQYLCAPDFSVAEMSAVEFVSFQVWRSFAIAEVLQDKGLTVVPALIWARPIEEELEILASYIQPGSVVCCRGHGDYVTPATEAALEFLQDLIKWERMIWLGPLPQSPRIRATIEVMRIGY